MNDVKNQTTYNVLLLSNEKLEEFMNVELSRLDHIKKNISVIENEIAKRMEPNA